MSSAIAIGIDLGTTHTLAAVYENGSVTIIPNKEGQRLTPSLVFYDQETFEPIIGQLAEDESISCPANFIFDIKRIIGRHYNDGYVQSFVEAEKSKTFPINILQSDNAPAIKLEGKDPKVTVTKSSEEITSEVLKYIKESVAEHLGYEVSDAVISVPAYFSYAQKAATKRAAEMVGLNVLKLITEPVAAAIQYTFRNPQINGNLLIFDLGGGTLDVSVISIDEGNFTVKAIEGNMLLGGRDFDEIIFNYLRDEIATRFGNFYISQNTLKGQRLLHRLRKYAKRFKEVLSTKSESYRTIYIDDDHEMKFYISRVMFEALSKDLFKEIIDKIKKCLQSAKLSKTDINRVVLVGGASRIPKVRELLSDMFNYITLNKDIHADEAVALGAGIHAALLKNQIHGIEKYKITELAPYTVGILAKYNLMVDFIRKGTTLPASESQIMHTTKNNQTQVDFVVYEGERKKCNLNNRLGGFSINNIPMRESGKVSFIVTMNLDEDGLLTICAVETSTNTERELQIAMENLKLCDTTKIISLEEENGLLEEDKLYEDFFKLRLKAETLTKNILHTLKDEDTKAYFISEICLKFLKHIEALNYNEIERLEIDFQIFINKMKKYGM